MKYAETSNEYFEKDAKVDPAEFLANFKRTNGINVFRFKQKAPAAAPSQSETQ